MVRFPQRTVPTLSTSVTLDPPHGGGLPPRRRRTGAFFLARLAGVRAHETVSRQSHGAVYAGSPQSRPLLVGEITAVVTYGMCLALAVM